MTLILQLLNLIYKLLHVSMKTIVFLILMTLSYSLSQPTCLLEEPLTDQCLNSITIKSLDKEFSPYLCKIVTGRSLFKKAEQICREAASVDLQSGYYFFKNLLVLSKFQEAFKTQYSLFFISPFNHNQQLLSILNETNSSLETINVNILPAFGKAIYYFYKNEVDKSMSFLKKHLQLNKENKQLIYQHFLYVRILEIQNQYYDGMNYLAELVKTNTKIHPYLYHLRGNFLMHHVQFQKAIAQFQKANTEFYKLFKANGFSFTNYNIGLCYQKLGKVEEAIKYYQKSIINLESAEALNALGHAYYSLQENKQNKNYQALAQKYYKKSLEVNPDYTPAIFNIGMLQLSKNNINKAISAFEKCLTMENTFRSCKHGLIKAYYLNKQKQKTEDIISSIEIDQQSLSELLAILYQLEDHQKALALAGEKEDYKSSELMQWKGFNQYSLGLYEKAERSFSRAIFLGAKKGYIYYSLGLSQLQLKKYDECSQSFDSAFRMDPRQETKTKREHCKKLLQQNDL